jgi:hypothetical protein
MFDRLFPRYQTRERHITSPLFQERLDYLQHCAEKGYAPTTLRPLATDLLLIQNLLGLPESSQKLEPATVRAAIEKWAAREPKYFSHKNGRRGRENLLRIPGQAEHHSGLKPNRIPGWFRTPFRVEAEHEFRAEAERFSAGPGMPFGLPGTFPQVAALDIKCG